ncbi:MAG: hypothetical protein WDM96_06310 [Lacunisphaera sp.]
MICLLGAAGAAEPAAPKPARGADNFMPFVELAPFVVNGKQLAISVYARSKRDRRYAEDFAEEEVKVVYESVTESTGKGLIIIGRKGEPHPVFVFRKFLALAKEGKLDPAVAARGPELFSMLDHWKSTADTKDSASCRGHEGRRHGVRENHHGPAAAARRHRGQALPAGVGGGFRRREGGGEAAGAACGRP